jgi:hypothetical protein
MRPGAANADRQAAWMQCDLPGFPPGGPQVPVAPTCLAEAHLAKMPDELRGDWEEGQAYPRLIALCNWLDRELDTPVQIIEEAGGVKGRPSPAHPGLLPQDRRAPDWLPDLDERAVATQ